MKANKKIDRNLDLFKYLTYIAIFAILLFPEPRKLATELNPEHHRSFFYTKKNYFFPSNWQFHHSKYF